MLYGRGASGLAVRVQGDVLQHCRWGMSKGFCIAVEPA